MGFPDARSRCTNSGRRQLREVPRFHTVTLLLSGKLTRTADAAAGTANRTPPRRCGAARASLVGTAVHEADEAMARSYELPRLSAVFILTGIDDREIDVTDVRLGLEGSRIRSATLGSSSTVFNSNLRGRHLVLPFPNYAHRRDTCTTNRTPIST